MKIKLRSEIISLSMACLLMPTTFSMAAPSEETTEALQLLMTNGQKVVFQLEQRPEVVFYDDKLQINTSEAQVEYAYADVAGFDFVQETTAIELHEADKTRLVSLGNGEWAIEGEERVKVYDLSGVSYDPVIRTANGKVIISLHALPAGYYVVTTNHQTFKIKKP